MRRDQLEHAIRTACQVIGRPEVIGVGSHRGTRRCSHFPLTSAITGISTAA